MQRIAFASAALACSVSAVSLKGASCVANDAKNRAMFQNKLAGDCEAMCKEVGAYPKCQCPNFVKPDATPGVMTWPELLEHMDNLVAWGDGELKNWRKQAASMFQQFKSGGLVKDLSAESACMKEDEAVRMQVVRRLKRAAGACHDMCKEVGAYPKCTCPDFKQPDATPGVMTWDELLEHMDNLEAWGANEIKGWNKQAAGSSFLEGKTDAQSCTAEDIQHRVVFQNKLAGHCEEMCKEVGAYPNCAQCPKFVQPDATPGVMTWDELNVHMDNLVAWGQDEIKGWRKQAKKL